MMQIPRDTTRYARICYMCARCSCAAALVVITGCSSYKTSNDLSYYLFRPDYIDTASKRAGSSQIQQVSDDDALRFSTGVRHKLRQRTVIARLARETSATLQVLTAAAAAALGVASGGVTPAMTALAATSAVVPQFQEVFDAKQRAEAYNQGVTLIGDAESRYLAAVQGKIANDTLTPAGANLILQVNATLKLVETALVSQIPDRKSYDTAHGIISEPIKPPITSLHLPKGANSEIAVLSHGKSTVAISENPDVATIVFDASRTNVLNVIAKKTGNTTFVIGDGSGVTSTVTVKVYAPISPSVQVVQVPVTVDPAAAPTVVRLVSDDELTAATPSRDGILDITRNNHANPREVHLIRRQPGLVLVTVHNASGAPPAIMQVE